MPTFDIGEAQASPSQLVEAIEVGAETEIIISRNGRPTARLVPIVVATDVSRRIGLRDATFPSMSLEEFNASDEEVAALFHGEPK